MQNGQRQNRKARTHNINFYFVIQLLFPAQHYKFGDNNTNELLIINLTSVRAGRMLVRNTTEHDKRTETGDLF